MVASKLIQGIPRVCLAVFSIAVLTQCSSVEREQQQSRTPYGQVDSAAAVDKEIQRDALQWMRLASEASNETEQLHLLIKAAYAFQTDDKWQQAAAVLSQIDYQQQLARRMSPTDLPLYRLVQARWLAEQRQCTRALQLLSPFTQRFTHRQERFQALSLVAECHAETGQFWQATTAQIEAEQYNGSASPAQSRDAIWTYLRRVPVTQLPTDRPAAHQLAGWWRIADVFHRANSDMPAIAAALQQWLLSYTNHPAQPLVAELAKQSWQPVTQLVALLPLSGDFAAQGVAVRDGILMSAAKNDLSVRFIDTHTTSLQEQQTVIAETNASHVVGPLLKSNVDAWKASPLPGVYHLLLNETAQLSSAISGTNVIEFALAPEDEARQAARYLGRHTNSSPMLLAAKNRSSERLVEAFQQQLQSLYGESAEVAWYQAKDEMQAVVERHLGVETSKARIRDVKIAAGKIIVDEQARSRADLDAIYLPGNLAQVRLLKPFIDVNLSPFAKPLTVYASSDVHQRSNLSGDSDLAGIHFTDSPALIERSNNDSPVSEWLTLRSDASLNQARLLAMGYDSLRLLQSAPALLHFPGIEINGLSGALTLPFGRVQRQLDWAIFSTQGIQPVE